jgi:hypothetical protein
VKENPGLQLARLQTHIVTLRKERYRLSKVAEDEHASTKVRSKAQDDAQGLSLEILRVLGFVKRLEEDRRA